MVVEPYLKTRIALGHIPGTISFDFIVLQRNSSILLTTELAQRRNFSFFLPRICINNKPYSIAMFIFNSILLALCIFAKLHIFILKTYMLIALFGRFNKNYPYQLNKIRFCSQLVQKRISVKGGIKFRIRRPNRTCEQALAEDYGHGQE